VLGFSYIGCEVLVDVKCIIILFLETSSEQKIFKSPSMSSTAAVASLYTVAIILTL
jgi:hypothetical protein